MEVRIPYLALLTQQQIEEVHENSVKILENVGISTDSAAIMDLCEGGGARVDRDARNIRISSAMIDAALETAPHAVRLCGRDPLNDILLQEGSVYFGMAGTGVSYTRDLETGKLRVPTKKDVADAARVGDALSRMSFIMTLGGAYDCPAESQYLHELEAKYSNTTKPVHHPAPGPIYARRVLQMAEVVAGGPAEFKKRPLVSVHSDGTSPLFYSTVNENIIAFAKVNAPVVLAPGPMPGTTGPGTVIGTFSLGNAETLFGVVLSQLANPGAPVVAGTMLNTMDMHSTRVCTAGIEFMMGRVMNAQMARFYGIPSNGLGACSDAKTPDAQAGAEAALTALINAQSGVNMSQCVGTMAGADLGSLELVFISDEIIGMVERFVSGVNVTPETLAFDVVKEVGPEGQFLSHDHTLAHFRKELFFPRLFDREAEQTWMRKGELSIADVARERVAEILHDREVPALSESKVSALSGIIAETEDELAAANRSRPRQGQNGRPLGT